MLFSSMIFLWIFLPITLIIYYLIDNKYKNLFLLISSFIFYSWGEPRYIYLMLLSIIINYLFGIFIYNQTIFYKRKILLFICIFINLGLLTYFKYFNFVIQTLNLVLKKEIFEAKDIILPIGISFYTFQALSYVVDVYRSKNNNETLIVQTNIFNLALYIALFPQLIAGPIVKYHDIEKQIYGREINFNKLSYGIKYFIYGLGKKVLIANTLASVADKIFSLNISDINTSIAWLGIICYSLQIYYDFSGYSDMAIGLGKMFGFDFMQNFNYPYISTSIQEFWRRWHISLSTWFREYLYIPLGGNRKGKIRTYINLLIVFFCTGLWHGASFSFIFWGLWHGMFLILERIFLNKLLSNNKIKILNNIYTLFVVLIGWVFFRVESFTSALNYLYRMFIPYNSNNIYLLGQFVDLEILLVLIIGILGSGFIQTRISKIFIKFVKQETYCFNVLLPIIILFLSITLLASGTYNPFIYFRF